MQISDTVSLIIPVYNAENYLDECIESVLNQTYSNIEIILIDDGSNDKSWEICNEFLLKDKRVVVIHQDNLGSGAARNNGLKVANGRYITFVDSDDVVSPTFIESLVNEIEQYKVSIAVVGLSFVESVEIAHNSNHKYEIYNFEEFLIEMIKGHQPVSVVNKIYLASILKENGIEFDTKYRFWEDLLFNIDYFSCISGGIVTDETISYYARVRSGSQTRTFSKEYEIELIQSTRNIWSVIVNGNHSKNVKNSATLLYKTALITFYYKGYLFDSGFDLSVYKKFLGEINSMECNLPVKKRIQLLAIKFMPRFAYYLGSIRMKKKENK